MQGAWLIAINAAFVGEHPTGLGLYALGVIHGLAALGERLVVYSSRPDLIAQRGVEVRTVPDVLRLERGVRGHLARLVWSQIGLRRRLHRDRPALMLNVIPEGLLGPGPPQITTVHDLVPLRYPHEYRRQLGYFRHYVAAVLRNSRRVIASSESTRHDLLRFYRGIEPENVRVVIPAYDAHRFTPDGPTGAAREPYALYVGNVMPHKNLDRVVEAFAAAVRRAPARLVIRGSGRARHVEALKRRIAALELDDRVDWRPYAAADALPVLYRGARVLLLPSLCEGHGFPVLEAMACGTPVIASDTSSLPELVGDAGLLVDPLDVGALSEAIVQVFTDDGLVKALRDRGLERARQFSWRKTAREIQDVIASAVDARA